MRRYLVWSLAFHAVFLFIGAVIAPLRGFGDSQSSTTVVSVGLVDFADPGKAKGGAPKPKVPEPAPDELIAKNPAVNEELAEIKVPEKPKRAETKPKQQTSKKSADKESKKDTAKTESPQLAVNDTAGVSIGVSDGAGGGDVWGVEVAGNANPYYREGGAMIRNNWRNPAYGRTALACVVRFRVKRSGEIVDIAVEEKSGSDLFDKSAVRALQITGALPPFPSFWVEDEQIIHIKFEHRP